MPQKRKISSSMSISVIIPVRNEEDIIQKTINHLKETASPASDFEIVIVDGESKDRTRELAQNAGAQVIESKPGRALQMNTGVEMATKQILYFLHADTLTPQNWDLHITNTITSGFNAGCFQLQFDDPHPLLTAYAWFTRFDKRVFRFGDQSFFITAYDFNQIGPYNTSLIVMEDNTLIWKARNCLNFKILDACVQTSARKYRENGVIRLQLIFGLIYYGYYLGLPQDQLVHIYNTFIRSA